MSDFAERLRQAMFDKHCKAVDVVRGTKIGAAVISRYLSGRNKPSSDNILAISQYLNVTPEWLLSSSDAPKTIKKNQVISTATEPLLKQIELQDKLIKNLEKQIKNLEEAKTDEVRNLKAQVDMLRAQNDQWKASSQDRHAKGKAKADLAISKHKNTLRIKTTRKPKK